MTKTLVQEAAERYPAIAADRGFDPPRKVFVEGYIAGYASGYAKATGEARRDVLDIAYQMALEAGGTTTNEAHWAVELERRALAAPADAGKEP